MLTEGRERTRNEWGKISRMLGHVELLKLGELCREGRSMMTVGEEARRRIVGKARQKAEVESLSEAVCMQCIGGRVGEKASKEEIQKYTLMKGNLSKLPLDFCF